MDTGEVEVVVEELELLSLADKDKIPFLPFGATEPTEDLKLKYRYLDLRTKKLQNILRLRSETCRKVRNMLAEEDFVEVETPILYKSTPEGARDYIVPSRVHPGKVYALPQSPQTLKQLLMIGGTDKYFQICRCFRDEDLRADRQPEFSQIDIEASYVTPEYIKNICEKIVKGLFELADDFTVPKISWDEAMSKYGCDRPDVRFGLEHKIVTSVFKDSEFGIFSSVEASNGLIKAIFVPGSVGTFSRKDIDSMTTVVGPYGGKGVAFFKVNDGERTGGISKFITDEIFAGLGESQNGTWLFCADPEHSVAHACADAVRKHLGIKFSLHCAENRFVWVYDFPLLEWDGGSSRFVACHHPFTMPKSDQIEEFVKADPTDKNGFLSRCKAEAYDLVCNGYEIAGGSIRIHRQDVQSHMFKALGMSEEEVLNQFGFFIEALNYGTPPHGGIAFGLDRTIMMLAGTENIRDVIAFPKTTSATDLMSRAPSAPAAGQTKELHFEWRKKPKSDS